MIEINNLTQRIIDRVNINLREFDFDVSPYIKGLISPDKFIKFYAFYGLTTRHPVRFTFQNSALSGSYFLGRCNVAHSILYKTDVRGDELKLKGESLNVGGHEIPLHDDEEIRIRDSIMVKTLVHNFSHDPESPEEFFIINTMTLPYANIHGAPCEGSFFGPFATADLTTVHDCVIGEFSYVQTDDLMHEKVDPGVVWVASAEGGFDFRYTYPAEVLAKYVKINPGFEPDGIFTEFIDQYEDDFEEVFNRTPSESDREVPEGASISHYCVIRGDTQMDENVLVAQRSYVKDAKLGRGANVQENCYIINSKLDGCNVTAHGGKIINADMGRKCFVGFNSFIRGQYQSPLVVGPECIFMPHTIIDLEEPLEIPGGTAVWGYVRNKADLKSHSIAIEDLAKIKGKASLGNMDFEGNGGALVEGFRHRIDHILEANGAFYDGESGRGHAQDHERVSFNILQPYREGDRAGIYPYINIKP